MTLLTHTDVRIIYQNQSSVAAQYILAGSEEFGSLAELANEHSKLTKLLTEAALTLTKELSEQFGAVDTPTRGGGGKGNYSKPSSSGSSKPASSSPSSNDGGEGITDNQKGFLITLLERNDLDVDVDAINKMSKVAASAKIKELAD